MDHRFREDENELPYLVGSKRGKVKGSHVDTRTSEDKVKDIVQRLHVSDLEKLLLKSTLLRFLSARDCMGLVAEESFTSCGFTIIRENKYIQTHHEFLFDHDLFRVKRVFWDCYTTHSHDKLLSNPGFRRLIDSTPYEFLGVSGGYEVKLSFANDTFNLLDDFNVMVSFKVDSKTKRLY